MDDETEYMNVQTAPSKELNVNTEDEVWLATKMKEEGKEEPNYKPPPTDGLSEEQRLQMWLDDVRS